MGDKSFDAMKNISAAGLRRLALVGVLGPLGALVFAMVLSSSALSEPDTRVEFDHKAHLAIEETKLECASCHPKTKKGNEIRPATSDHGSCDNKDCHASDFYGDKHKETKMCRTCHMQSSAWADMSELWPYPNDKLKERTFFVQFDHKHHMELDVEGGRLKCAACHHIDPGGKAYTAPTHPDCAGCHDAEHKVPMTNCSGCHLSIVKADGTTYKTKPSLVFDVTRVNEKFKHDTHRQDGRKSEPTPISCDTCHGRAVEARTIGEIKLVSGKDTMEGVCRKCHNARSKTAEGKRIFGTRGASCKNCHSKKFMDLYYRGQLPSSH